MKRLSILLTLGAVACGSTEPEEEPDDQHIPIRSGEVTIMGSLDLPTTPGPYPVMIFVPGSGRSTRADDRPAASITLPQGIALFRYDKRGLGQSTGTFEEVTVENSDRVLGLRADDVSAIVEYLAGRNDVKADQILLWGASQGAWVAPLVTARTSKVALIIGVSGGGSSVGTSDHYDELADDPTKSVEELTAALNGFSGPFGYDPVAALRAMTVPALWIFGGLDRSNPTFYDIAQIERVRQENGRDFTIELFPTMNHDLVDANTGTFPSTLFSTVFNWARSRLVQ